MKFNIKDWLPYIVAVLLFILIPAIYFLPALKGLILYQSDISNFMGVSKEIFDFRASHHSEPLWTNSMFGGMPSFQVSTIYPSNLVQYLFVFLLKWIPYPISLVFLYCLGFFILLRVLDVNPWLAIAGSFAFAFSSFFFILMDVGHNSEANAIAFMCPVLAGVILAFKGKQLAGTVLTGAALALELYCDHPQITYYLFLMVLFYGLMELYHSFRTKTLPVYFKTVGLLGIAAILAIGTDITSLWMTYDYGKYSTRGKSELTLEKEKNTGGLTVEYATQWSYGIPETMTLLIPNYQGGESKQLGATPELLKDTDPNAKEIVGSFEQYWGDQPTTAGPVYVGAIICFFAFLGLFFVKGRLKWYIFFVTLFSIMLAWGSNFLSLTDLFFHYFPGYNMFRAVTMILAVTEITLPLLAVLALDKIFKSKNFFQEKIQIGIIKKTVTGKNLFIGSLIVVGGFTLLCFLIPSTFSNFEKTNEMNKRMAEIKEEYGNKISPQQLSSFKAESEQVFPSVKQAREKLFTSDAGRSLVFILLAGFLVWLYAKKIIERKLFTAVLSFFIIMDMALVDWRYLDKDNFKPKRMTETPFTPDAADQEILKDQSPDYRVVNLTVRPDQDSRTSYFHKSLGGYSGVKMKRYDQLLGPIEGEFEGIYQVLNGRPADIGLINMLNTKYAILPTKDNGEMAVPVPGALGNAWFVGQYKKVLNADSEFIGVVENFDPARVAIVDRRFGNLLPATLQHDSSSSIKMTSYEPNDLKYVSNSKSQELAVFSEMYYPDGWNAYIDDKPADYFRANFILRAMVIPAGQHTIEFKFHPAHYFTGEKISLASNILLILGCLGFFYVQLKKKPEMQKTINPKK